MSGPSSGSGRRGGRRAGRPPSLSQGAAPVTRGASAVAFGQETEPRARLREKGGLEGRAPAGSEKPSTADT